MSNTNIFPRTDCPKRTDADFRAKRYGNHHKLDSPLLQLDIDMIEQFPVGDSLHLLHLGIMKRLLLGWRDGSFRNSETNWPTKITVEISDFLVTKCKMPKEIHRAVRGLDCLKHWKGTEYRTFLHYVGIVALKKHTSHEVYQHFLLLFCAVTICASRKYLHLLPMAQAMLDHYIECFREIYGEQYMTSNVHNLTHLVDDVKRFGELESFSAYAFENRLGHIKQLLRNGRNPLAQVAKRLIELTMVDGAKKIPIEPPKVIISKPNDGKDVPVRFKLKYDRYETEFYSKLELNGFVLSTDMTNKWFLSQRNEIVCLKNILSVQSKLSLLGSTIISKTDFFERPIKSSALNIYATDYFADENSGDKLFTVADIKCKLVRIEYDDNTDVFIPLLHTNSD